MPPAWLRARTGDARPTGRSGARGAAREAGLAITHVADVARPARGLLVLALCHTAAEVDARSAAAGVVARLPARERARLAVGNAAEILARGAGRAAGAGG